MVGLRNIEELESDEPIEEESQELSCLYSSPLPTTTSPPSPPSFPLYPPAEPSLIFQTTDSQRSWLGRRGQWRVEVRNRRNWLNIGTSNVFEGSSESVIRFRRGKDDLFAFPRLFLNENRSEEENPNEDFGMGCSEASKNIDEVEAVGNLGSERTGDDCVMADQADQLNFECLGKRKTKEKNPVRERRNKKANGVRIAIPLEDILQTKGIRSKDPAKHLKVSRSTLKHNLIGQSCPNETPAVVDQEGIPQLNSDTLPSDQALVATVDTNIVVIKEIPQRHFSLTENPDEDFGNDEAEAVGMVGEGTGEGKMEEGQLNSEYWGKGKRKKKIPGEERGNKKTNGVRIGISLEEILQTKGMSLKDAANDLNADLH